jgi:prophage antirepressor-like protein
MDLIVEKFNNSSVRILLINGIEWFVAKDTAELLGYVNTRDAISQHCKKVTTVENFKSSDLRPLNLSKEFGNNYKNTKLIPESDVWRLIIKSRLPEAEKIEEWIMEEVLPSIRKTGSYSISEIPNFSELLSQNEDAKKLIELFEETKPFRLLLLQKLLGEKSISSLFQLDFSKIYFLPTELGKLHGLSGRETNLKLEALGFQISENGIWKLTSSGKEFGIEIGGTYHQLKWKLETPL